MATEAGNQSTEWVMMSDLVQCKLCFNTVKNPRVLSGCKHMFCMDCLWQWWQESCDSDMAMVVCPTCRDPCSLPTEGVSALQGDAKASRMGEMLKQCVVVVSKDQPDTCSASATATGPTTSIPPCDVCSLDTEREEGASPGMAIKFCEDCQNHLCVACSAKHDGTSVFSRHKVRELGKVKGNAEILCSKHPGKPLRYYCNTCPSVSCSVCVTTQHSQGHSVSEIHEMVEAKKMEINHLMDEVQRMSQGLDNRDAITEELVMRTKEAFWAVGKQVSDYADHCRKEIEEVESHLLEEIESKKALAIQRTREEGRKRNYSIIDLETLQSYGHRLLTSATSLEFVSNCTELEERMKTVLQFRDKATALKIKGLGLKFMPQPGLLSLGRLEDVRPSVPKPLVDKSQAKRPPEVEMVSSPPQKASQEEPKEKPEEIRKERSSLQIVVEPPDQHRKESEDKMVQSKTRSSSSSFVEPPGQYRRESEDKRLQSKTRSSSSSLVEPPGQYRRESEDNRVQSKARSSSSSLEDQRLMAHSGQPRHRQHERRSSGHEKKHSERRSHSQADRSRRNADRARRHSGAYDPVPEERTKRSTLSALAMSTGDLLAFREEEGAKFLWEAKTMDTEEEITRPRDVGFLPSGEVFVLNDHFHNLVHFSPDGKTNRVISNDFTSPMCVVVTKEGHPAVTDSQDHCIKLFSSEGTSYSVWKLENLTPSGAVITRSGSWLVLDKIDDCFGVFSGPGASCKRTVPLGKHLLYTERYIACDSKGRIFVSGSEDTAVAVFDPDGNHIMDMGGAGSKGGYVSVPRGLYVDSRDNLVVADRHNHRVSMFSPDGRFIRHLVTCPYEKVVWPTGIDFTSDLHGETRMAVTISDNIVQVYDVTNVI